MRVFTDPIPKPSLRRSLLSLLAAVAILLFLGSIVSDIEERAVEEYIDQNYEELYNSAYRDGYDDGYADGHSDGADTTMIEDAFVGLCDSCRSQYDPTGLFYRGFGLCNDCGKSKLNSCAFCGSITFSWGIDPFFAVCPDCLGEALEKTDIQELLVEFNENR